MMTPIVGIGAGGHAKVIIDALRRAGGYDIRCLVDGKARAGGSVLGIPVLPEDETLDRLLREGVRHAFIAVASLSDTPGNKRIYDRVVGMGFEPVTVTHPSAVVAESARIGRGCRIFAGALLNPDSVLGDDVVVNTGAIVEHDCRLDDHAQIAPGAQLAGNVHVGEGSIVGLGASVIQGVRIGRYAVVGAGSVVIKDVPEGVTVVGIPARALPQNQKLAIQERS